MRIHPGFWLSLRLSLPRREIIYFTAHFPDHDSGKNYVNEGVRVEFVKRRIFDTMGYERGYVCTMRNAVISLTSRNRFVVACMVCPFFLSMMKNVVA